jgi:hypothetical protein
MTVSIDVQTSISESRDFEPWRTKRVRMLTLAILRSPEVHTIVWFWNWNGLVSVFLRKLEYCTGILFLTTNPASEFDEVILSRIYLSMRYDNLCKEARRDIGLNSLKGAYTCKGPANISHK